MSSGDLRFGSQSRPFRMCSEGQIVDRRNTWLGKLSLCQLVPEQRPSSLHLPHTQPWPLLPQQVDGTGILVEGWIGIWCLMKILKI
jgi:hypothetical protein